MSDKRDALLRIETDIRAATAEEPEREYVFHPPRRWRFDFAWPARRLALEVDGGIWIGGRHITGVGLREDHRKFNAAVLDGWRVLRFTSDMVLEGEAFSVLEEALRDEQG